MYSIKKIYNAADSGSLADCEHSSFGYQCLQIYQIDENGDYSASCGISDQSDIYEPFGRTLYISEVFDDGFHVCHHDQDYDGERIAEGD